MILKKLLYLDEIDYRIILSLHQNGRQSLKNMSKYAGVSIPTVSDRITKLFTSNIILKILPVINFNEMLGTTVVVICLEIQNSFTNDITEELKQIPEIIDLFITTGKYDLIIKVIIKDEKTLNDLILNKLKNIKGVEKISTNFVIENIYDYSTKLPKIENYFKILCHNCQNQIKQNIFTKVIDDRDEFFCSKTCLAK